MATATLTSKGQVVIPADIRTRYSLTPGTQVEFVDNGRQISLRICRRVERAKPEEGFAMLSVDPQKKAGEKLADFDPASLLADNGRADSQ